MSKRIKVMTLSEYVRRLRLAVAFRDGVFLDQIRAYEFDDKWVYFKE